MFGTFFHFYFPSKYCEKCQGWELCHEINNTLVFRDRQDRGKYALLFISKYCEKCQGWELFIKICNPPLSRIPIHLKQLLYTFGKINLNLFLKKYIFPSLQIFQNKIKNLKPWNYFQFNFFEIENIFPILSIKNGTKKKPQVPPEHPHPSQERYENSQKIYKL